MKLTKSKLKQIIKEEFQNEVGGPPIQNPADPQFGLKSDLAGAEGRAGTRGDERDILQAGMREIEEIAQAAGYEDILAIIQKTSMDYQ